MPKKSRIDEKKKKRKSRKYRNKLSQKVIQNVIVKVGEARKAKKARKKQRRLNRADLEAIQEQQINSKVSPVVVYQAGAPFQAPQQIGQSFQQEVARTPSRENPQYLEVEPQPLEFIERPTKREAVAEFIDPVAEAMDKGEKLKSAIYTRHAFPQEKVEGNYSFGVFDESSSDTASINTISGITQPASRIKSLGEWINDNGTEARYANEPVLKMEELYSDYRNRPSPREMAEASSAYPAMAVTENPLAKRTRKPNRPREEIQTSYRAELKKLIMEEDGMTDAMATQYSVVPTSTKEFKEAIRLQKLRLKRLQIRKQIEGK